MDHLTRGRPSFQQIIDRQRVAQNRLKQPGTMRSEAELGGYRRSLGPVPVSDVQVDRLPLVRFAGNTSESYLLVGEIAQQPGRMVLLNVETGQVTVTQDAQRLELVPPADL